MEYGVTVKEFFIMFGTRIEESSSWVQNVDVAHFFIGIFIVFLCLFLMNLIID